MSASVVRVRALSWSRRPSSASRSSVDVLDDVPRARGLAGETAQALERLVGLLADRAAALGHDALRHGAGEVAEGRDRPASPRSSHCRSGDCGSTGRSGRSPGPPGRAAQRRADRGLDAEDGRADAGGRQDRHTDRPRRAADERAQDVGPGIARLVLQRHQKLEITAAKTFAIVVGIGWRRTRPPRDASAICVSVAQVGVARRTRCGNTRDVRARSRGTASRRLEVAGCSDPRSGRRSARTTPLIRSGRTARASPPPRRARPCTAACRPAAPDPDRPPELRPAWGRAARSGSAPGSRRHRPVSVVNTHRPTSSSGANSDRESIAASFASSSLLAPPPAGSPIDPDTSMTSSTRARLRSVRPDSSGSGRGPAAPAGHQHLLGLRRQQAVALRDQRARACPRRRGTPTAGTAAAASGASTHRRKSAAPGVSRASTHGALRITHGWSDISVPSFG